MEHLTVQTQQSLARAVLLSPALDEAIVGVVAGPSAPRAVYDYDRLLGLVEQLIGPQRGDGGHRMLAELAARCRRLGERGPVIAQPLSEAAAREADGDLDVVHVDGATLVTAA